MRVWPQRKRTSTATAAGLIGVLLLAGCSSSAPQASDTSASTTTPPTTAGLSRGDGAGARGLRCRTIRRASKSVGAQGLDDVGLGASAQASARDVGTRRRPAGVDSQRGAGDPGAAVGPGPADATARRRHGPTPRFGLRRLHPLHRRERSGRRLRLRRRQGRPPAHRRRRPSRCPQPRPRRRIFPRLEERRRRTRWGRVLFDWIDGKHLRRGPHCHPAAGDRHAGSARRRAVPAVRDRRAQRHGAGGCAGRRAVDGRQQSRQRRGTRRRPVLRPGGARLRQRASAGVGRETDPGTRVGLAVLQSRRRSGEPVPHPRRPDQCRRLEDGLCRAATDRAEHGCALGAAWHDLRRRRPPRALRSRRVGRGPRFVEPSTPSRPGGFVLSMGERHPRRSADPRRQASRTTTGPGGADRSLRWWVQTAPCTSPTMPRTPFIGWRRRDGSQGTSRATGR